MVLGFCHHLLVKCGTPDFEMGVLIGRDFHFTFSDKMIFKLWAYCIIWTTVGTCCYPHTQSFFFVRGEVGQDMWKKSHCIFLVSELRQPVFLYVFSKGMCLPLSHYDQKWPSLFYKLQKIKNSFGFSIHRHNYFFIWQTWKTYMTKDHTVLMTKIWMSYTS
jgi:hypothetical protein